MTCRAALLPLLLLAAAAAGCRRERADGPLAVSVIGPPIAADAAIDPDRGPLDPPRAALALATRQGLLRFDAGGQVVAGLAGRWTVGDDGRSLLFRLPDDRRAPDAAAVARRLRAAIRADGRNPLLPLLGAIVEVDAVTPQVVDVELRAPRPNLLQLFAQPALTMTGRDAATGPFRIAGTVAGGVRLRQVPAAAADPDDRPPPPETVVLRGERAATAVARFRAGAAALVLGGGFDDLPIARVAPAAAAALRVDPVQGLFGLAFAAGGDAFAADPANRRAAAMAIDRDRVASLIAPPGWQPAAAIVAAGTPEIAQPAQPDWASMPIAARRAEARAQVDRWRRGGGGRAAELRVAMPGGPGGRRLLAALVADWRAVGIAARTAAPGEAADLQLIDEVAATDSAAFYLRRFACDRQVACTVEADRVLIAAREAGSLEARRALLVRADAMIAATAPFIALGPPVRWSLVSPALDRYRDSPRALHPLDELRTPPRR